MRPDGISKHHPARKEPGFLEKILIQRLGRGKHKMRLDYRVARTSECSKKQERHVKKTQESASTGYIWDDLNIKKKKKKKDNRRFKPTE